MTPVASIVQQAATCRDAGRPARMVAPWDPARPPDMGMGADRACRTPRRRGARRRGRPAVDPRRPPDAGALYMTVWESPRRRTTLRPPPTHPPPLTAACWRRASPVHPLRLVPLVVSPSPPCRPFSSPIFRAPLSFIPPTRVCLWAPPVLPAPHGARRTCRPDAGPLVPVGSTLCAQGAYAGAVGRPAGAHGRSGCHLCR